MHDTASDPQPVNGLASDSASPLDPGPVSTDESAPRSQSFQQLPKPVASQPPPVLAGLDASDPCRMLVPFLNALSELEGPRHAARAAADPAWTGAYAEALQEVIGGINGECLQQSCIFFHFFFIYVSEPCAVHQLVGLPNLNLSPSTVLGYACSRLFASTKVDTFASEFTAAL